MDVALHQLQYSDWCLHEPCLDIWSLRRGAARHHKREKDSCTEAVLSLSNNLYSSAWYNFLSALSERANSQCWQWKRTCTSFAQQHKKCSCSAHNVYVLVTMSIRAKGRISIPLRDCTQTKPAHVPCELELIS